MAIFPLSIYIFLCLLVGFRGMRVRIGYWGTAILSFLLTPIVVFVALLLLDPAQRQRRSKA